MGFQWTKNGGFSMEKTWIKHGWKWDEKTGLTWISWDLSGFLHGL
jgi:hypothetical protein